MKPGEELIFFIHRDTGINKRHRVLYIREKKQDKHDRKRQDKQDILEEILFLSCLLPLLKVFFLIYPVYPAVYDHAYPVPICFCRLGRGWSRNGINVSRIGTAYERRLYRISSVLFYGNPASESLAF